MKKLLMGLAVLPFLSGVAFAAQPLNDQQMDKVTAGFDFSVEEQTNYSTVIIHVNQADNPAWACNNDACSAAKFLDVRAGFVHVESYFGNVSSLLGPPAGGGG